MKNHSLIFYYKKILSMFALGFCISINAYSHNDLTLVDWGGEVARAHMQNWVIPWESMNDKHANLVYYNGGLEKIRDQVNTTNVIWDVVDMDYPDLLAACEEGLLEKIDHSSLSSANTDFIEGALVSDCGVGTYVWSTVFAYNTTIFGNNPPRTIADFFNIKDFAGNRGLRKDPRGTLEWALLAAGVPASKVYEKLATPSGLNLAFAELEKLKPYIIWWTTGDEPKQLLESGTVTMTAVWNGRLYRSIVEDKKPMAIVWDGQVWEISFLAIPKGSRHLENAKDFIKFATSSQSMANIASYYPIGPTRKSARVRISDSIKPYLPTENLGDTVLRFNAPWWAENLHRINKRFDRWATMSGSDIEGRGGRF